MKVKIKDRHGNRDNPVVYWNPETHFLTRDP